MKSRHLNLAVCSAVLFPLQLRSQDPVPATADRAAIPGSLAVAEFVPPAPVPPKQIPAIRIDAATTVPSGNGKTLTILRGEASTLPDIPSPPEPRPQVIRERTADDLAREIYRRRHSIQLGATVYDHRVSVVRWQHPDTRAPYEAVCGFDLGLLAGIGRFVRNGENYDLMLLHSMVDTKRMRNLGLRAFPEQSEVANGSIRLLKGDPENQLGTTPIHLIKELLANEKTRLEIFQADLERHRKARTAWESANPVPPRDETFWIRPHRGSRYLMETVPAENAR